MNLLDRNNARTEIARKIRALRVDRHWTQAELSRRLGLSQGRFSEIERGQGSFTAEQFLEILTLFKVQVSHFAAEQDDSSPDLQNVLARLGAIYLQERAESRIAGLGSSEAPASHPGRTGPGKDPALEQPPMRVDIPDKLEPRNAGRRVSNSIDMDWD